MGMIDLSHIVPDHRDPHRPTGIQTPVAGLIAEV